MVPVVKPNGSIRICVDLKRLNNEIEREKYPIPTVEDIVHKLNKSSVFSKLDAKSGFHQIPLDESSAKLTTFITPFGRFYFNRLPFGISSAPEIFQRIMENIVGDIDGVICYFDDILIHTKTEKEHKLLLDKVKSKLTEAGLELNEEKCEYFKAEINFLGHIVSQNGMRPDSSKVKAICDLQPPKNINELRRYLGMINYLGRYIPRLSTIMNPINTLLFENNEFIWGNEQQTAFDKVKSLLTTARTLAYYDVSKETVVEADSSSFGLGGVLLQYDNDRNLRPIAFCSRTLTNSEKNYAQIEKECLASTYACEKFDKYLMGIDKFTLYTDHKPLIPLMNTKDLTDTPLRCQRLLIRLMRYKFTAIHKPGKQMQISDTLSRSPCVDEISATEFEVDSYVNAKAWPVADSRLKELRDESQKDYEIKTAMEYTLNGWPTEKENVVLAVRNLFAVRGSFSVHDGLLVYNDRLVIPYKLRAFYLSKIHEGHLGIVKCRERASQSVWWPGLSSEIKEKIGNCEFCVRKLPSQTREPLLPTPLPSRPFEKVAADICEKNNKHYLIIVDYYSRWLEILPLNSLSTTAVTRSLSLESQSGAA